MIFDLDYLYSLTISRVGPKGFLDILDPANNLYGWAMSQEMPDSDFEWVSQDECREIELLMNYADGRIAIFDLGIFNHRVTEEEKKSFILEVDLEYPLSFTIVTMIIRSPRR